MMAWPCFFHSDETDDEYRRRRDDYIRRELQIAFDQVDRGEVTDLDMSAILDEAHRRHAAQKQRDASPDQ
jgi:hypothetical protein